MGSEVRGPGTGGPGLPHVAAPVARAWAVAAATAAVRVPAGNAEADAWTVRGWADVAIGCGAPDGPGVARPPPARSPTLGRSGAGRAWPSVASLWTAAGSPAPRGAWSGGTSPARSAAWTR